MKRQITPIQAVNELIATLEAGGELAASWRTTCALGYCTASNYAAPVVSRPWMQGWGWR